MRLGLFLTTLIGLAGASHISSAADATWIAVAHWRMACRRHAPRSVSRAAMAGPAYWQVDIKGNTLTFTSTTDPNIHSPSI